MKRRFGKVLEAFWFVIAIAFGLVWVRGYWWEDEIRWKMRLDGWAPVQVRTFYARSASGCVELGTIREQRWEYREWSPQTVGYETNDWPRHPERRVIQSGWRKKCGGFGVMCDWPRERTPLGLPIPYASIVSAWAPSWFVWLVIAVMPEKWVYGWIRRSRRMARGMCGECGYDLRGGGERCPECGRVKPAPQLAVAD